MSQLKWQLTLSFQMLNCAYLASIWPGSAFGRTCLWTHNIRIRMCMPALTLPNDSYSMTAQWGHWQLPNIVHLASSVLVCCCKQLHMSMYGLHLCFEGCSSKAVRELQNWIALAANTGWSRHTLQPMQPCKVMADAKPVSTKLQCTWGCHASIPHTVSNSPMLLGQFLHQLASKATYQMMHTHGSQHAQHDMQNAKHTM